MGVAIVERGDGCVLIFKGTDRPWNVPEVDEFEVSIGEDCVGIGW
jgi:hypothetical protein